MVDTRALGARAARRGGSSPLSGTRRDTTIFLRQKILYLRDFFGGSNNFVE